MTIDEKMKVAKRLLRSALVYDHVKFLMTGKKNIYVVSDVLNPNADKLLQRRNFDKTRDIAHVLEVKNPHLDRLNNYRKICQNEIEDMEYLLKDRKVRMNVVKNIMAEEQMDMKRDFSFCSLNVKARVCGSMPFRTVNTLMVSLLSKLRARSL